MVACMGERGRLALGMVSRMASWPQGGPSPWWLWLPVVRMARTVAVVRNGPVRRRGLDVRGVNRK